MSVCRQTDRLLSGDFRLLSTYGIQKCILHLIRNSTRYVSYSDLKKVTADLKPTHHLIIFRTIGDEEWK